jgi:hypothetical protein
MSVIIDKGEDYGLEDTSQFLQEFTAAAETNSVNEWQLHQLLFRVRHKGSPFTLQQRHEILEDLRKTRPDKDQFDIAETKLYVVQYLSGMPQEIKQAVQNAFKAIDLLPRPKKYDAYNSLGASTRNDAVMQYETLKGQIEYIDDLPVERQRNAAALVYAYCEETSLEKAAYEKLAAAPPAPVRQDLEDVEFEGSYYGRELSPA